MCARRASQRGVLVLAILLAAAPQARAQKRQATLGVSVNVVRSCVIAAPDGAGQHDGESGRQTVTVRCGRGAADVVALDAGQRQRPVIAQPAPDGRLQAGMQIFTGTSSRTEPRTWLGGSPGDPRTLVATVDF
jgi:hypothetical protein